MTQLKRESLKSSRVPPRRI